MIKGESADYIIIDDLYKEVVDMWSPDNKIDIEKTRKINDSEITIRIKQLPAPATLEELEKVLNIIDNWGRYTET